METCNICSVKITKLVNLWEEMEVFVKNWEGSIYLIYIIPQYVAIATVKTS